MTVECVDDTRALLGSAAVAYAGLARRVAQALHMHRDAPVDRPATTGHPPSGAGLDCRQSAQQPVQHRRHAGTGARSGTLTAPPSTIATSQ